MITMEPDYFRCTLEEVSSLIEELEGEWNSHLRERRTNIEKQEALGQELTEYYANCQDLENEIQWLHEVKRRRSQQAEHCEREKRQHIQENWSHADKMVKLEDDIKFLHAYRRTLFGGESFSLVLDEETAYEEWTRRANPKERNRVSMEELANSMRALRESSRKNGTSAGNNEEVPGGDDETTSPDVPAQDDNLLKAEGRSIVHGVNEGHLVDRKAYAQIHPALQLPSPDAAASLEEKLHHSPFFH
ncbi:hypothetical protein BU24DRAFT_471314 [Aaosphaeria arxii CBS 175.79]|uniref:Uncharacterized protein n=1 Tax=Aaosphaeria arxii CBS 175.79 TaxID=1450172 RepID=A0A6A5YAD4_9PLEO|nr:uncharacterized protein BU24DRAFT_471314 [Aaosphaeria arxii CBS 175.79]KAF2022186.1 hypothetical protein BU24DRAFT_471314 [Aaosphaeria arxii CBS 175.79]